MSEFICPKCGAPMRTYQRRDVAIEQCVECRGVYLDRGKLEHLTRSETAEYGDPVHRDYDDDYDERHEKRPRKRRRGFLDDLLDFG